MATPIVHLEIQMPSEPLFVGSYARLRYKVDPPIADLEDLEFVFSDGLGSGQISLSQEPVPAGVPVEETTLMLLAGFQPGPHKLEVISKSSGSLLFEDHFELTTSWADDAIGPSRWITGDVGRAVEGSAWGGGPTGPQNINVIPQSGTRRIAIVLVDTKSQRYTTDAATLTNMRNRWLNEVFNGVAAGGVTRSTRLFYREVSYNGFDLSAQVFGPFSLPDDFDDYFNSDGSPKGNYYQAVITAADGGVDYTNFDSVLCVSRGVDATATEAAKNAWPYASIPEWGPYTTADGDKKLGVASMPHNWGLSSTREVYETFSHELGHNLGMGDMYNPTVPGRNPDTWEMMHNDNVFPHFSIGHRMMLGWVNAGWVRSFDFQSMALPVNQTVTLHPIELGAPPSGRSSGVEIRIADGWNYYFEYRVAQTTQIGDRNLDENRVVLVTDVQRDTSTAPIARPQILLAPKVGAASDGAILSAGEKFEQDDTTTSGFPAKLKVTVLSADNSKAEIRVEYGVLGKPDPSIRPWPASADRRYQSPDIEVQNARTLADAAWFNTPWVGETNTLIAKVKNSGVIAAPSVQVNFFIKDFNVGGAPEAFLGSDTKDIPAGSTVNFTTTWIPPRAGHYCVVVRIPLYQTPDAAAIVEMTEFNNVAQSNYDRFISDSSSPATRRVTSVTVGNPYKKRTRVIILPGQDNPTYRTYLEHQWLILEPGETREVQLMFEYAAAIRDGLDLITDPQYGDIVEYQRIPNRLTFSAYIEDPRDSPIHALNFLGGADVQVVTGRATRFDDFNADDQEARGRIVTVDTGDPVPPGKVILITTFDERRSYQTEEELPEGEFVTSIQPGYDTIQGYYVPADGYGDAYSEILKGDPGPGDDDDPGDNGGDGFFAVILRFIQAIFKWLAGLFGGGG